MCYPHFINEETQVHRDEVTLPGFISSKQAGLGSHYTVWPQTPELMVSMIILYCLPFLEYKKKKKEAKGNNTVEENIWNNILY